MLTDLFYYASQRRLEYNHLDVSIDFKPFLLNRISLENFQHGYGKHISCQRSAI